MDTVNVLLVSLDNMELRCTRNILQHIKTMVETRSDRCFYIYHRTRSSRAHACAKSYDKWKRLSFRTEVYIIKPKSKSRVPSRVKPCAAAAPPTPSRTPSRTPNTQLKSPPPTDTTIPLPSALKSAMEEHLCQPRNDMGEPICGVCGAIKVGYQWPRWWPCVPCQQKPSFQPPSGIFPPGSPMEIELQTRIQREQIMRFKRDFHECPPTEIERQNRIHREQLDMLKQTFFQRTRRRVQRPITTDKPMDK